ncbi:MAG TPA: Hsp20/alpha crystallin family protein [Candidatus Binatia bacterium]|nr:Hsp20/alpha crystallin family protein [Candidatus Binatia bacterium]
MAMERWRPFGVVDRWEPFRNVSDIQGEVNRLFDTFLGRPVGSAPVTRAWLPAVDMHETNDDLVLTVEVPGVREKDVTVSITGDLLSIKGERRWDDQTTDQQYLHTERVYGQFERLVQLPMAVQAEKVKATYRDGVLQITLPKAEELKPRQIKIDIL